MSGFLQRIALGTLKPSRSIQPLLGSLFSPTQFATTPETPLMESVQLPNPDAESEFVPRNGMRPSLDLPGARGFQTIENRVPTADRFFVPLMGQKENADTLISLLLAAKGGDRQKGGSTPEARHESIRSAPSKQVVDEDRAGMTPGKTVAGQDLLRLVPSKSSRFTPGEMPGQTMDGQGKEIASRKTVVSQDVRTLVPTKSSQPILGRDDKETIASRRTSPGEQEPNDIQIHIGRIEVVAVPTAPERPASPKPRRGALSLDEYLRRQDRRAR
jgi:hypothetical protein